VTCLVDRVEPRVDPGGIEIVAGAIAGAVEIDADRV
jgi:hypothetical protein